MGEGYLFLKAVIVGMGIAAPVGPVGVLCVRRTLSGGPWLGLSSGLGAAIADALYGAIAAFGLTAVGDWLLEQQDWVRLGGGLFLLALGVASWLRGPRERRGYEGNRSLTWAFSSALLLTLANPITLLSFAAIFAAVGLSSADAGLQAGVIIVTGVFLGSAAWWLGLGGLVLLLREKVTSGWMRRIHYGAALLIISFGLYALGSFLLGDPFAASTK